MEWLIGELTNPWQEIFGSCLLLDGIDHRSHGLFNRQERSDAELQIGETTQQSA
jgi:hypothetical protein